MAAPERVRPFFVPVRKLGVVSLQRTLESLPLEGKVAFAKQMTDEVASARALS